MFTISYKNKYLKQRKKFEDSGIDLSVIDKDIRPNLMANKPLDPKYQNHKMQGRMKDYWDCHPRPDVVLIYRKDKKNKEIEFCDLDKHSNLFGSEDIIMSIELVSSEGRQFVINCAKNTNDFSKNLVRVKSSNVWAYNMHIRDNTSRTGDVIAQFKNKEGGPGDIYIYYDVPIDMYRRWSTSPSKGHFFWQYIRNNFQYSKLTGNKKGKLRNAVN